MTAPFPFVPEIIAIIISFPSMPNVIYIGSCERVRGLTNPSNCGQKQQNHLENAREEPIDVLGDPFYPLHFFNRYIIINFYSACTDKYIHMI